MSLSKKNDKYSFLVSELFWRGGRPCFQEPTSEKRVPERHQFLTLWHQTSFNQLADASRNNLFPEQALIVHLYEYCSLCFCLCFWLNAPMGRFEFEKNRVPMWHPGPERSVLATLPGHPSSLMPARTQDGPLATKSREHQENSIFLNAS